MLCKYIIALFTKCFKRKKHKIIPNKDLDNQTNYNSNLVDNSLNYPFKNENNSDKIIGEDKTLNSELDEYEFIDYNYENNIGDEYINNYLANHKKNISKTNAWV